MKELEKLDGIVSEKALARSLEVLTEGLEANQKVRSGKGTYDIIPDQAERRKSAELILAYALGKPVAKNLNVNLQQGNGEREEISPMDMLKSLDGNGRLEHILNIVRANAAVEVKEIEAKQVEGGEAVDSEEEPIDI